MKFGVHLKLNHHEIFSYYYCYSIPYRRFCFFGNSKFLPSICGIFILRSIVLYP